MIMKFLAAAVFISFVVSAPAPAPQHHGHSTGAVYSRSSSSMVLKTLGSGSPGVFKDGVVSCSQFPSGDGVIPTPWLGLGGWASIMSFGGDTSEVCKDGFFCSYACQAGMSKTQWPVQQPADGMSIGGLYCDEGFLYRTNPDEESLCRWGVNSSYAINSSGNNITLCRTDYPGSESMVVPTFVEVGGVEPISVVNETSYFKWEGRDTSAQYYVCGGVSVEECCVWGEPGSGIGNWAPVVLGAGFNGLNTYLSIIPNPNNHAPPNFSVKIVPRSGSNAGECKYENGVYTGGRYGCTVAGDADFVFY